MLKKCPTKNEKKPLHKKPPNSNIKLLCGVYCLLFVYRILISTLFYKMSRNCKHFLKKKTQNITIYFSKKRSKNQKKPTLKKLTIREVQNQK